MCCIGYHGYLQCHGAIISISIGLGEYKPAAPEFPTCTCYEIQQDRSTWTCFSSAAASKATGHSKGRGDCVDGADLGSIRVAKLWTPTLLHSLRQSRLIPEIELLPAWPHVTGGLQRSTFLQGLCASPNAIDPFVSWTHLAIWQGWIRNFWVQRPQTHSKGWENMGKRSHVLSLHSLHCIFCGLPVFRTYI